MPKSEFEVRSDEHAIFLNGATRHTTGPACHVADHQFFLRVLTYFLYLYSFGSRLDLGEYREKPRVRKALREKKKPLKEIEAFVENKMRKEKSL